MMYKFLNFTKGYLLSGHGFHTWEVGKWYSVNPPVIPCQNGFHASNSVADAFTYVRGGVLATVEGGGDFRHFSDKSCYEKMRITRAHTWTMKDSVSMALHAVKHLSFPKEYVFLAAKVIEMTECCLNGREIDEYSECVAEDIRALVRLEPDIELKKRLWSLVYLGHAIRLTMPSFRIRGLDYLSDSVSCAVMSNSNLHWELNDWVEERVALGELLPFVSGTFTPGVLS